MIDHSKPWTAHCTSPKFARFAGQRILAKDGSIIVVVSATKPKYIEDQDRYRYTYLTRPATEAETAESLAANADAAAKKEAATRDALRADDERHVCRQQTRDGLTDTTDMASSAFDAAAGYCLSNARLDFAKRYARCFSDETDESICHKARLVRGMQEKGMSWSEATAHPDVYLGSEDRDYVSYLLYHWQSSDDPHLSLDEYRHKRLIGYAIDAVRRAIADGGDR